MTREERRFFNDVKDAVSDYDCSFEHYNDDDEFCVDVEVDIDQWGENADEIWEALENVALEWDGYIDSDMNTYYLGVYLD